MIAATVQAVFAGSFRKAMGPPALFDGPKPGDRAPDFSLAGSDGRTHRLHDYAGVLVVLAWFPKAFTGG